MFFAFLGVLGKDREAIMKDGFFQGYSSIVWTAIALQVAIVQCYLCVVVVQYSSGMDCGCVICASLFSVSVSIVIY